MTISRCEAGCNSCCVAMMHACITPWHGATVPSAWWQQQQQCKSSAALNPEQLNQLVALTCVCTLLAFNNPSRPVLQLCPPRTSCALQYTGTLQLDDFASHSEPDEYVFTLTADAVGEPERRELYKGVVQSLYPQIVETLQRITAEMLDV